MVWSKWKAALLLIAACAGAAGVAWSQQTPNGMGPKLLPVKYVTIHEDGQAIRCQFLETLRQPGGRVIHRVRAVKTGEVYELEETNIVMRERTGTKLKPKPKPQLQPRRIPEPLPTLQDCKPTECGPFPSVCEDAKRRGLLVRLFGRRNQLCNGGACSTGACCTVNGSAGKYPSCKPGSCSAITGKCTTCADAPTGKLTPIPSIAVNQKPAQTPPQSMIVPNIGSPYGVSGIHPVQPIVIPSRPVRPTVRPVRPTVVPNSGSTYGVANAAPVKSNVLPKIPMRPNPAPKNGSPYGVTGAQPVKPKVMPVRPMRPAKTGSPYGVANSQPVRPIMKPKRPTRPIIAPNNGSPYGVANATPPRPRVAPRLPKQPTVAPKSIAYPVIDQKPRSFVNVPQAPKSSKPGRVKSAPFPVVASPRPTQDVSETKAPRKNLSERIRWMFRKRPAKTVIAKKDNPAGIAKPFNTSLAKSGKSYPNKHVVINPAPSKKSPQKQSLQIAKKSKKVDGLPTVPFDPNWRKSWGKTAKQSTQPPGQSLVQKSKLPPVSSTESGKGTDPLLNPNLAANDGVKKKFGIGSQLPPLPQVGQPAPQHIPVAYPPVNPNGNQMPMGVQSVLAAKSGMVGKTTYVPVPVVTVPNPVRPPGPPYPKVPEPPQANKFVNAFTPPPSKQPKAQQGAPNQGQAMMPRHPGQMPPGYAGMPYPPNPHMRQPMPPQQGYGRYPVANVNYPRQYAGPRPPYPMTADWNTPRPVMPAQYRPALQPTPNGYPLAAMRPPMPQQPHPMYQQQPQPHPMYQQQQLLGILKDSGYPSQREVAAQNLSRYDWRQNPHVLQGLLTAAKNDPSATVRAGCVHCLTKMNVDTPQFRDILAALEKDEDPRVRHEVNVARTRIGLPATTGQPGVQHVGGTNK